MPGSRPLNSDALLLSGDETEALVGLLADISQGYGDAPPSAERLQRAIPSSSVQHRSRSLYLHEPSFMFRTLGFPS